jgi:hypothetical protein
MFFDVMKTFEKRIPVQRTGTFASTDKKCDTFLLETLAAHQSFRSVFFSMLRL